MKPMGIIGAMGLEVELLRDRMEDRKETVIAQRHFYSGKLGGKDVVLVCSGIGKVNAALTAQILIDRFDIGAVINTGIAGGTYPGLKVRDVVISDSAAYHDMDPRILALSPPHLEEFRADPELAQRAADACKGRVNCRVGRIATGDQFISDSKVRRTLFPGWIPAAWKWKAAPWPTLAQPTGSPLSSSAASLTTPMMRRR